MKAARALVPLVVLTLSACSGPSLPFGGGGSSASTTSDATLGQVQKAYQDLMDNYVDQPDSAQLLQNAFAGARKALTAGGIADAQLAPPILSRDAATNWAHFASAYDAAVASGGGKVPATSIENGAISGMADGLNDCLTHYYDPAAYQQRQAELQGQQQFAGIGVLMKNIPGHPTVLRVLDGPAQNSGLKAGDEIVAVNGKSVAGQSFEDVRNSIRGPAGQPVTITVKRVGSAQTLDFTIQRATIQAPVFEAGIIGGTTGYIHIYSFPQGIQSEVYSTVQTFDQRGVKSVIIDLRANTGGDHQTILTLLSYFIKSGKVETETDRGGQAQAFSVDGTTYWKSPKPVILIVDEDTQSGGELFAKAMQEEGGYPVVGSKTAGCAASARTFDLGGGAAIEVSTGKIVSGKGADINRAGVTPDHIVDYPVADLAAGQDPQLGTAAELAAQLATGQPAASAPATGSTPASSMGSSPAQTAGSAPASGAAASPSAAGSPQPQPAAGGGPTVIKPVIRPNGSTVLK